MARLARHAHLCPTVYGRMTPAQTRTMNEHVTKMLDDEWGGFIELAKMIAMAGARRM